MAKRKTCGQCKNYEPISDNTGECYRYPPDSDGVGSYTKDIAPIVSKDRRSCGEYNCNGWNKK